jgi:drug/metabolite transporter (DMT)-like permease
MKAINRAMGLTEWLLLIALSILWGGSFFFVGVAVHALPRFTIVALRVGIAAAALNVVVRTLRYDMPRDRRLWAAFIVMGLLNNVIPFSLIVSGQAYIASGLAAILNATTPIFTVIVAHFLTSDERMSKARLAGVGLGFLGVVLVIGPDALRGLGANTVAQLAILGAALSYAFAGVFGRRFRKMNVAPLVTATGQLTASSLVLIPLAVALERPWTLLAPSVQVWSAVLGLALLSTALAYILYFRILATAGASNTLLVTFLIPVTALLLGTTVLGETLDPGHLAGMGLIGAGLAAIDGRPLGLLRRRVAANPAQPSLATRPAQEHETPVTPDDYAI